MEMKTRALDRLARVVPPEKGLPHDQCNRGTSTSFTVKIDYPKASPYDSGDVETCNIWDVEPHPVSS